MSSSSTLLLYLLRRLATQSIPLLSERFVHMAFLSLTIVLGVSLLTIITAMTCLFAWTRAISVCCATSSLKSQMLTACVCFFPLLAIHAA